MDVAEILRKNKAMKKWMVLSACLIFGLVAILVVVLWLPPRQNQEAKTLPPETTSRADFHVYYPKSNPSAVLLDDTSVSYSGGVFMYTLHESNGSGYITVSQQKTPQSINVESILRRPDKAPEKLSIGTLYDMTSENKATFAISTSDDVLIYVNPSNNIDATLTRSIINNLR